MALKCPKCGNEFFEVRKVTLVRLKDAPQDNIFEEREVHYKQVQWHYYCSKPECDTRLPSLND